MRNRNRQTKEYAGRIQRAAHGGSSFSLSGTSELFIILTAACLIWLILLLCISNGGLFSNLFYWDRLDTGMDFFNSVAETRNGTPYSMYTTLYPPLANLFFYFIQSMVPGYISSLWPDTHLEIVDMRSTNMDMRAHQELMLPFIIFTVLSVLLLYILIEKLLAGRSRYSKLAAIACVLSHGVLYAVERGNIILISLLLALFFMAFHDSENKAVKELALIALAVSAGLKLYPAVLGMVLIKERRWKDAVRTVIYGVICFIVPFFVFEGTEAIPIFFKGLFSFSNNTDAQFGLYGIIHFVLLRLKDFFGIDLVNVSVVYTVCRIVALFGMLYVFMTEKKKSREWLALILILIYFQESVSYTLCFFIIPFIAYLQENKKITADNCIEFILYMIWLMPLLTPMVTESRSLLGLAVVFALMFVYFYLLISAIRKKGNKEVTNHVGQTS